MPGGVERAEEWHVGHLLALYDRVAKAPDAIARLRRFMLDLAVWGKLVEQDPADELASELLERIANEKTRLVKADEIRKPKSLPAIEEAPFALPMNWVWARMREVTSDRGQTVLNAPFTYIDARAINKEVGIVSEPEVLEASDAPSRARKMPEWNDFDRLTPQTVLGRYALPGHYRRHWDPNQERFFGLLSECLKDGVVSERMLREETARNHVRHDALELVERTPPLAA